MKNFESSDEVALEALRDQGLAALTIEDVNWALQGSTKQEKQQLLSAVGLKLDPRFMKRGLGPLIQARLPQLRGGNRWKAADLLRRRCLAEFSTVLGDQFDDPTVEALSDAVDLVADRVGRALVCLTLVVNVHQEAKAAEHVRQILARPEWANFTHLARDDGTDVGAEEAQSILSEPASVEDDVRGRDHVSINQSTTPDARIEKLLLLPIQRMLSRVESAKVDSDVTYYANLLFVGEMVTKLVALSLAACIDPDRDENGIAYATQHSLVRADSIGSWAATIQDLTTAPVFRILNDEARSYHSSLTQRFGGDSEAWQRKAVDSIAQATACFPTLVAERVVGKTSLAHWFQAFAALRNKTRGHGADLVSWQASAAPHLYTSLSTIIDELSLFTWDWWLVYRTSSGEPKLHRLAGALGGTPPEVADTLAPGIYVDTDGGLRAVRLLRSNEDLSDFYLPNGDAQDKSSKYEELSYISGEKRWAPLADFMRPPRTLPASETQGSSELRAVGNVLTNLPEPRGDYVRRASLEGDLQGVLTDARHPVVAINGPGGIGKTSLALQVLHDLAESEAFTAILWFSARDIDLDPIRGPLAVQPAAQSLNQIARQYVSYVEPKRLETSSSDDLIAHFLTSLGHSDAGPMIFVFDNFETVHNPAQLFRDLNEFVRLPNKILITTRYRDFKGDWPLDVDGMTRPEFDSLISSSSSRLGIRGIVDNQDAWIDSLFHESGGHPYVVNVALGEVARTRKTGQKFERIMASKDEILDALFERSFNRLSPHTQRVFYTMCRWRARIPTIALEAVLTRPSSHRVDVEAALQHLVDSSLIERTYSEVDAESYLHVPAAAYRFGTAQMKFSDIAELVDEDARYLHLFGAVSDNVAKTGFSAHVHRFYDNARSLTGPQRDEALAIGEYVARRYPESWLLLANLHKLEKPGGRIAAKGHLQSYLARRPDDADAWLDLAEICRETGDEIGELRATAHASQNAERAYGALSASLARLRERCDAGLVRAESNLKRGFLVSLCRAWHSRERQASVADCYNLARLAHRANSYEEALYWSDEGLAKDRNNQLLRDTRDRALGSLHGRAR